MKILLVEDDNEYVSNVTRDVSNINQYANFDVAQSRDKAYEFIGTRFYDLIILDLKLPTVDGALDEEAEHGYAVFEFARLKVPGTPIIVLTGSSGESFIDQLTAHVNQADIWGGGTKLPSVNFIPKFKYGSTFENLIRPYLSTFSEIFDVELQRLNCDKNIPDDRLIRVFSTSCKAAKCTVQLLNGGLSGVRVYKLKLTNDSGAPLYHVVTKIGSKDDVADESERFDRHVSRLEGKATPRKLTVLNYGAAGISGVFYQLAEGYESEAFAIAGGEENTAISLVTQLMELTQRWRDRIPESKMTIREIRRHSISDERFDAIRGKITHEWVEEFESRRAQANIGCAHGDMHGLNVLSTDQGQPILIDYGDVGEAPVSIDAITLELSLFFHPKGPLRESEWPTEEQARNWSNLEVYLEGCPMPGFISSCRGWALKCAAGNREIAAVAYGYLARQLRYPGQNELRIMALMAGAKSLSDLG